MTTLSHASSQLSLEPVQGEAFLYAHNLSLSMTDEQLGALRALLGEIKTTSLGKLAALCPESPMCQIWLEQSSVTSDEDREQALKTIIMDMQSYCTAEFQKTKECVQNLLNAVGGDALSKLADYAFHTPCYIGLVEDAFRSPLHLDIGNQFISGAIAPTGGIVPTGGIFDAVVDMVTSLFSSSKITCRKRFEEQFKAICQEAQHRATMSLAHAFDALDALLDALQRKQPMT